MNFEALLNAVTIAEKIEASGISKGRTKDDYLIWSNEIQPLLDNFSHKFKIKNPSNILYDFMSDYLMFNKHRLDGTFAVNQKKLNKTRLEKYCWTSIYKVNLTSSEPTFMDSPQLTLTLMDTGINCGFSYGSDVKNRSEVITKFRKDLELRKIIIDNNSDCFFYKRKQPNQDVTLLSSVLNDHFFTHWNTSYQIYIPISKSNINSNIKEQIITALDRLVLLFIESIKLM